MTAAFDNHLNRAATIAAAFDLALAEGQAHEGATAPNPAVGCVLMDREGRVVAAAGHARAGAPHAEAAALALAHAQGRRGALHTAVVTLEPCAHHGRTGPCADALIEAGLSEVWYALPDPNPQAGGGAARLAEAGVAVRALDSLKHPDRPVLMARAQRLLAPFASRIALGRPFVTVKQALDAHGSMIPPPGAKTFTSAASLALAHRLRRRADAILTGSGTILADRPEFTVRHVPDIPGKSRHLVILDRRGRVDAAYVAAARNRGFVPGIEHDIAQALARLAGDGCNEVLVEAGPALTQAIHSAGLWDEWVTIRKGANPDGSDRITLTQPSPQKETA